MNGREWLQSLGGGSPEPARPEWLDVLVWAQEQHPGRGEAARWLADELGVNVRSAQRYLALDAEPKRGAARSNAEALRVRLENELRDQAAEQRRGYVAGLLREMSSLKPGTVEVVNKSDHRPAGTRRVPPLDDVDLDRVADLWEADDEDGAEEELSDVIMDAYGGLSEFLLITDYLDGIDYD